jgi:phosphoribosylformylglycinamidine synthase
MALAGGIGAALDAPSGEPAAAWFGEDQGRYVVTISAGAVEALRAEAGRAQVSAIHIGTVGGAGIGVAGADLPLGELRTAHERWLPDYMEGR